MDDWWALILLVAGGAGFLYAFLLKCLLQLDGQYDVGWSLALGCGLRDCQKQRFGMFNGLLLTCLSMAIGVGCFIGLVHFMQTHGQIRLSI